MHVRLNLASRPPTVELREPADFSGVVLTVVGEDVPAVANVAFARYGRIVDQHTGWVTVEGLLELAEGAVDDEWQAGFDAMLDQGADAGWVNDDRTEVQARLEWD